MGGTAACVYFDFPNTPEATPAVLYTVDVPKQAKTTTPTVPKTKLRDTHSSVTRGARRRGRRGVPPGGVYSIYKYTNVLSHVSPQNSGWRRRAPEHVQAPRRGEGGAAVGAAEDHAGRRVPLLAFPRVERLHGGESVRPVRGTSCTWKVVADVDAYGCSCGEVGAWTRKRSGSISTNFENTRRIDPNLPECLRKTGKDGHRSRRSRMNRGRSASSKRQRRRDADISCLCSACLSAGGQHQQHQQQSYKSSRTAA